MSPFFHTYVLTFVTGNTTQICWILTSHHTQRCIVSKSPHRWVRTHHVRSSTCFQGSNMNIFKNQDEGDIQHPTISALSWNTSGQHCHIFSTWYMMFLYSTVSIWKTCSVSTCIRKQQQNQLVTYPSKILRFAGGTTWGINWQPVCVQFHWMLTLISPRETHIFSQKLGKTPGYNYLGSTLHYLSHLCSFKNHVYRNYISNHHFAAVQKTD